MASGQFTHTFHINKQHKLKSKNNNDQINDTERVNTPKATLVHLDYSFSIASQPLPHAQTGSWVLQVDSHYGVVLIHC